MREWRRERKVKEGRIKIKKRREIKKEENRGTEKKGKEKEKHEKRTTKFLLLFTIFFSFFSSWISL